MERRVLLLTRLIGLLFIVSCAQSQETMVLYELHDPAFKIENRILYRNHEVYTGIVVELNEKNDTLLKATYKEGKLNGVYEEWYSSGRKNVTRYYENAKKTGKHYGWWENGNKKFEIEYQHDLFSGSIKEWNENGGLYRSGNYLNGQEEGLQQFWRPNGKLYANYVVKNGRQYGLTGTKNCVNVRDSL